MDQEKLEALRHKYRDQPHYEVDDPEHAKAMLGGTDMLTGIATLCDAPYKETAAGLDIALIGVPSTPAWCIGRVRASARAP